MLKKKIGEILVDLGAVTQAQLNECLLEQKTTPGKLIGQLLVARNFTTKLNVAKALAQQVGVPLVEKITEQMADPNLLSKVPLKFLRQHGVVPLMYEGHLTLVTANPRDLQPLDDLSLLMTGDVVYAVSTEEIIGEAINKYYPLETSKEMMDELKEGETDLDLAGGPIEDKDLLEMANDAPIVTGGGSGHVDGSPIVTPLKGISEALNSTKIKI